MSYRNAPSRALCANVDIDSARWYFGGMKTKTSITLSRDILSLIDEYVQGENNRSAFIELAVRTYLEILKRGQRDQYDLSTINRLSEKLNKEAADVLKYQTKP
jgi:metal-responsive CopG/Arc/MetJ family transcriptional regulator